MKSRNNRNGDKGDSKLPSHGRYHHFGPLVPSTLLSSASVAVTNEEVADLYGVLRSCFTSYVAKNKDRIVHVFDANDLNAIASFMDEYRHLRMEVDFDVGKAVDMVIKRKVDAIWRERAEEKREDETVGSPLPNEYQIREELKNLFEFIKSIESSIRQTETNIEALALKSREWVSKKGRTYVNANFTGLIEKNKDELIKAIFTPADSPKQLQEQVVSYLTELIKEADRSNNRVINFFAKKNLYKSF